MEIKISDRLKHARETKHLSLRAVSSIINITPQSLVEYEKGKSYPKLETLLELCDCYNVSLNYIVYGNELGLKLETDLQRNLEVCSSLFLTKKLVYDENNKISIICDDEINKYIGFLKIYDNYVNENPNLNNAIIERIIYFLNNSN